MADSHRGSADGARRGVVRLIGFSLLAVMLVGFLLPGTARASATGNTTMAAEAGGGPPNSSTFDWAQLHRDSGLSGFTTNTSLAATNVNKLGVRWATSIYAASLDSPVVSHSSLGMLTFIGTASGDMFAFKVGTAAPVWGRSLGGDFLATPVVSNGAIWVATSNPAKLYKLDLTTGATECSVVSRGALESSITAAQPPGGKPSIYVAQLDIGGASGPVMSIAASNCAVQWQFDSYPTVTGSWAPLSYGVDAKGIPLILVGTSDLDSAEYAINARNGREVWRFQGPTPGDYDMAAGATISAPGTNGFADGVAYVPSKYGTIYALDLTTGAKLWSHVFNRPPVGTATETGRSTAVLDGTNLVFGRLGGVIDLNAVTGATRWTYSDPTSTEVLSSVAVAGHSNNGVVFCADLGGSFHALSLASGAVLYNYQTGGYIVSSPAVSDNDVLIASTDGLLYDFSIGGGNGATLPAASVTSPAYGASVTNPNGSIVITGTAGGPTALSAVDVAIESGGVGGTWWDKATNSWSASPIGNPATLASPGQAATTWSFHLPVPAYGGSYLVTATAHEKAGQASTTTNQSQFAVLKTTSGPRLSATQFYVGAGRTVSISGGGFSPNESVAISLRGSTLTSIKAGATGNLAAHSVTVPAFAAFGESSLLATGQTSARRASVPVYITNSWDDPGNDPGHSGFAANDKSYGDIFFNGGNSGVDPAWDAIAGSAIGTSAAVASGVAYEGDSAGQVMAVDVHTGTTLWTWQDPSGEPIDGAPTIDPKLGQVVVGTADGSVVALTTAGALRWTASLTGSADAPVVSGGLVYVSSSDGAAGAVTAFAESTGALSWTSSLPGPATSAVAVDPTGGVVAVGGTDGTMTALSTSDGSLLWTFAAGGALESSPVIVDGSIFVGSADDNLYALSETTGSTRWTYDTGAPITASPVVNEFPNEVFVGSSNGALTGLSAGGGAVQSVNSYGSAVVGIAAVTDAVFVTCANGQVQAIRPYGLQAWEFDTGGAITAPPVIVDGAVYVGNANGNVYAFTPYGHAPL